MNAYVSLLVQKLETEKRIVYSQYSLYFPYSPYSPYFPFLPDVKNFCLCLDTEFTASEIWTLSFLPWLTLYTLRVCYWITLFLLLGIISMAESDSQKLSLKGLEDNSHDLRQKKKKASAIGSS